MGFGTATFGSGESTVVGSATEEIYPDILTNSATATNTCGLEVTADKECGDSWKIKKFDICGCIKVCEHECVCGCEGERKCSDGRYTATQQRFTTLVNTADNPASEVGELCSEAAGAAAGAGGLPPP